MDLDQCGDDNQSDSGVSADFSPNSMSDNETPIEREIRLSFKREQSLRRSRGLDETNKFIEIPFRKSIFSQDLTEKSEKDHSKERQFAGKKMQREIYAEAEREKALVKLGRLPGYYDKGTVKQLKEKKRLFEAFQESKGPQPSTDRNQEPIINPELHLQNKSHFQPTETSNKNPQNLRDQHQESFKPVQEVKNGFTSCDSTCIINGGNQATSSKEHTKHLERCSSAQVFPSLKEKMLMFESFKENKIIQTSKDHENLVSGCFKENRKNLDVFFQNQNSGFKSSPESKELQIKGNQDEKSSGFSKEPVRNLQVQNLKPSGPGFSEAADRQVIIIENNPKVYTQMTETDSLNITASPGELHYNSPVQKQVDCEESKENPFFKLRSSRTLLPDVQKDIREAKKREEEFCKQRTSLYGSKVTVSPSSTTPAHNHLNTSRQNSDASPVSSSFGKLDLTWPPPSQQNGHRTQPEVKDQRQRNLLVQRWESGLINGHGGDYHHN